MKLTGILFLAALAALPGYASSLSFTLTPPLDTVNRLAFPVSAGFSGTLTDTDAGDDCDDSGFVSGCLNLNDITFTFDQDPSVSLLTADPNPFFNNLAGFLSGQGSPFDSVSGQVFGIIVAPGTPAGIYTGTVSIIGEVGAAGDMSANTILATEDWTLDVVAPEPAAFGLMIAGFAAIALARRVAL